jgi:hypothetical protein
MDYRIRRALATALFSLCLLGTSSALMNLPEFSQLAAAHQLIELTPDAGTGTSELVNLGIPFAQGVLTDPNYLRILDETSAEVPAYVARSLTWFGDGSVRAVKVQIVADMSSGARTFAFDITQPRTLNLSEQPYDNGTAPGKEGFPVPRVLATLEPEWMTRSSIAGPQTVAAATVYDSYVAEQWLWARDTIYTEYSHWLYDRVSTIAKLYVRTGDADALKEAFNSYRFYMDKIKTTGTPGYPDCAGGFAYQGKECDSKYVYIEPVVLMLGLTGDDTQHNANMIDLMVGAWETGGWSDPFQPYTDVCTGGTERQWGLALSAFADAYLLTGDSQYLTLVTTAVDYLYDHQTGNPDGHGNDGCWRHSWEVHEGTVADCPGNVIDDRRCSPWMSAMVIGGLYTAWEITGDPRIEEMVLAFADFMESYGWIPSSWYNDPNANDWHDSCQGPGWTISGYSASSIASVSALVATQNSDGWYSDSHNPELLVSVAWAWTLETDAVKKQALADRVQQIEAYFTPACAAGSNPPRMFGWQNREGSLAYWLLSSTIFADGFENSTTSAWSTTVP